MLEENFKSYSNWSDVTIKNLLANSKKKTSSKNTLLFQPPSTARKIFFLESGLIRGYKLISGKDFSHHFFTPGWFVTDYESYLSNKPGSLFIETLTEVEYYEFDRERLYNLFEQYHAFEKLGRIIAEKAYLMTVQKLSDLQTMDLKTRYQSLIQRNPQLFLDIPQKHIATYLGVSEQSLSRIKKP